MILYFSATGNSRHIAEVLAEQLGDSTVDAAMLLKEGKRPDFYSMKPYVFVSPVYAWRIPRVFERLIKESRFRGNNKAYFVLTCGDSIGAASGYVKRFAEKQKFMYMGIAEIVMPENYIVMFEAPSAEDEGGIIQKATDRAMLLRDKIAAEEPFAPFKNTFVGHLCSDIVTPFFYRFYIGAKKFYTTDACISCGKCERVCMLNNITLKEGKPVWGKDCTHCMACISRCPTEAIEYGKHTVGLRRYVFPTEKGK